MKLQQQLGEEWYNLLLPFLKSPSFTQLRKSISLSRETCNVIPSIESNLMFRAFRDCPPSKINVVLLGMDCYHSMFDKDTPVYDGYAFSNGHSTTMQPSLRNIVKEINRTFPDNVNVDRFDLEYLVKQGVFLVNTALTVIQGNPGAHLVEWMEFSRFWIKELGNRSDIIWLLLGKNAQSFEPLIDNGSVLKFGHPSPLNRVNPLIGSDCFIEVNKELKKLGKQTIVW